MTSSGLISYSAITNRDVHNQWVNDISIQHGVARLLSRDRDHISISTVSCRSDYLKLRQSSFCQDFRVIVNELRQLVI